MKTKLKKRLKQKLRPVAQSMMARVIAARRCESGVAATEFALIFPVMVLMFFGMVGGADVLLANERLSIASNSLVDLVAQSPSVTTADLTDIFDGVESILAVNGTSTSSVKVVSIILNPSNSTQAIVDWSVDKATMNDAYPQGALYTGIQDISILKPNMSLIVVEYDYAFNSNMPGVAYENGVVKLRPLTVTLESRKFRVPRRSARVALNPS